MSFNFLIQRYSCILRPTQDRWLKLRQLIQMINRNARLLMSLIGLLPSTEKMVPEGRLHMGLAMAPQGTLEVSSVTGQAPSLVRVHVNSSEVVAQSSKCPKRIRASSKRPQHLALYRCLKRSLGRSRRARQYQQLVDYSRNQTPHQRTGTERVFLALKHFKL